MKVFGFSSPFQRMDDYKNTTTTTRILNVKFSGTNTMNRMMNVNFFHRMNTNQVRNLDATTWSYSELSGPIALFKGNSVKYNTGAHRVQDA